MGKKICFPLFLFLLLPVLLSSQTAPKDFLGFEVGADRKLADYNQIMAYFQKLDQESKRIQVVTIGQTTLKKPLIMAIISSEANMNNLDRIREISFKLREARGLDDETAKALSKEGKTIVMITCSQHSSEIAASQMSMELAYNLATGNTPFDAEKILDDVVILLCPTTNPDGHQMVTEWYRKWQGTEYEGARMPWLYHHYAGHDNNRDWFMFNLPETRAVTKVLYHDWIPQIHIDEHQMGSTGARLFLPPFMNPPVPTVHPLVWRGVALTGVNMAYDLQQRGYTGVVYDRSFTAWWIGACDDTSWLHNSIGLLSEMASVGTATPIYIEPNELPNSYSEKRINFPDPWPGGWWKLRHLVDYELVFSMSLIKTAHLHKDDFLYNFYQMCRDGVKKWSTGQPYAFVINKTQSDYPTMLRFLEILKLGGIEVHRASEDFLADGKAFKAGSFLVMMSQPYRPYAQALLEKQKYPDMRQYPGGPPIPPYDNAGWTLPLQMGINTDRINHPFKAKMVKVTAVEYPKTSLPDTPYIVLDTRQNASYSVALALLNQGLDVFRTSEGIKMSRGHAYAGDFVLKNSSKAADILAKQLDLWHLKAHGLESIEGVKMTELKSPRIAMYQSWRSNMDEGWTRYALDDLKIPFTTIHNADFKPSGKGKKKTAVDLNKRFDVIIFASENPETIKTGTGGRRYGGSSATPEKYKGGIGKEGVDALKTFVAKGGILVTLNAASGLAMKEFGMPVSNALDGVSRNQFFCPTSILKVIVDNKSPIGYGLPAETSVVFSRSMAYNTRIPGNDWDRKVVAHFPKDNILKSGWLLGEETLSRKPAVVDTRYKKGRIVLIGIRCQHRAQSHGSYKFLLNALLYPRKGSS